MMWIRSGNDLWRGWVVLALRKKQNVSSVEESGIGDVINAGVPIVVGEEHQGALPVIARVVSGNVNGVDKSE